MLKRTLVHLNLSLVNVVTRQTDENGIFALLASVAPRSDPKGRVFDGRIGEKREGKGEKTVVAELRQ